MAAGGGGMKILGGKNEKGERKTEENYIQKRGKRPVKCIFWDYKLKPPAANLFARKKIEPQRGVGEMIEMHNKYLCICIIIQF